VEIQVSFPGLEAWLSYETADDVSMGDHVQILEGTRRGMIGTVEALQRGSFKGRLCRCQKTDQGTDEPAAWEQDLIVKSRMDEVDVVARQVEENRLREVGASPAPDEHEGA
jgi:hypothetical protein